MEHYEDCERVGVARTIAPKLRLSREEFNHFFDGRIVWGVACNCDRRGTSLSSDLLRPKAQLRRVSVGYVLQARQEGIKLGSGSGDRISCGQAELEAIRASYDSQEGRVIPVDFKNRRRM